MTARDSVALPAPLSFLQKYPAEPQCKKPGPGLGVAERALRLRTLVPPEDPGSVRSTCSASQRSITPAPEVLTRSDLCRHMVPRHIDRQDTHTRKKQTNL